MVKRNKRKPDELNDPALLDAFLDRTLPCDLFHHREHLRIAWLLLRQHGDFAEAAVAFRRSLRAYATACGGAGKYHETLTWAWLALVQARMVDERGLALEVDLDSRAFLLRCPDLLDARGALAGHYDLDALLLSDLARRVLVLP